MKKKLCSVLGRQIPIKAEGSLRGTLTCTAGSLRDLRGVCVCGLRAENKLTGTDMHVELLKMYLCLVNSPVPLVVEHVVFGCKACLEEN